MTDEILDDQTIWKQYVPIPNFWFSTEIIHEGWGIATFENPSGTLEGKTTISVDELGKLDIVMDYEKLNTEAQIYGSGSIQVNKFLRADFSQANMTTYGPGNPNPCISLTVQTETGIFSSEEKVFYHQGWELDGKIKFMLSEAVFEETGADAPKYWALPLTNFMYSFPFVRDPVLTQHPLRLFSTPSIPDIEDEEQKRKILLVANWRNRFIPFYFGESIGYIQPLPDYAEKTEKLKSGQAMQVVTALMIGEVNEKMGEVWFPYDYTNLISFALGTVVSASWVEFRDKNGRLTKRKYIHLFEAEYKKGYAVTGEMTRGGLGHLISCASNSPEFGKSYIRVLIGHLVRLQSHSRQIEDHMDLLCRTFDMLCEEFGFSTQNLAKSLPVEYQTQINTILEEARKKVQRLSKTADSEFQPTLQKIENRIQNANNKDRAFGLAVLELLKKFELPDAMIMEKFYALYPEYQGKSWAQSLTVYRGAAVHTGYFSHEKHDIQDVLVLEDHLQDILVRIALKILSYEGTYQPRMIRYIVDDKTIQWINENTPATDLGYKLPIV